MGKIETRETAADRNANRLRESNQKIWKRDQERVTESLRKQVESQYGIDVSESEVADMLDLSAPGFSIREFRESAYKFARSIREANMEGVVQQLLRVGIQTSVNKEYIATECDDYEAIVTTVTSNKAIELYAPLYRSGFMSEVGEGDEAPELTVSGQDMQIKNKEFAAKISISRNAIDDDQTSQLTEQASQAGENGKLLKASRVFIRWLGTAGTDVGGNAVAASQTGSLANESTWPYFTSSTNGAAQNRLTSYAALSYMSLIQLELLARKMKDPKGQRMGVRPDTLICGVGVMHAAHEIVDSDSMFYPSTGTIKQVNNATVGSDTGAGVQHAKNILKGKYHVVDSIFLPDTAYGLMQAGKGFTLQQRRPLETQVENPLSGPALSARVLRYFIDERYEVDWREPRFAQLGNDGSVI